jgi:hypothetical protein
VVTVYELHADWMPALTAKDVERKGTPDFCERYWRDALEALRLLGEVEVMRLGVVNGTAAQALASLGHDPQGEDGARAVLTERLAGAQSRLNELLQPRGDVEQGHFREIFEVNARGPLKFGLHGYRNALIRGRDAVITKLLQAFECPIRDPDVAEKVLRVLESVADHPAHGARVRATVRDCFEPAFAAAIAGEALTETLALPLLPVAQAWGVPPAETLQWVSRALATDAAPLHQRYRLISHLYEDNPGPRDRDQSVVDCLLGVAASALRAEAVALAVVAVAVARLWVPEAPEARGGYNTAVTTALSAALDGPGSARFKEAIANFFAGVDTMESELLSLPPTVERLRDPVVKGFWRGEMAKRVKRVEVRSAATSALKRAFEAARTGPTSLRVQIADAAQVSPCATDCTSTAT